MVVTFGICADDPRTLHKTLTTTQAVNVQINHNCDAKNPAFLLDVSNVNFAWNYARCAWGSFFISKPDVIDGVRCVVRGTLDYLDTYAAQIAACTGYLVRTQTADHKNKYVADGQIPVQERRHMETYAFNKSPFSANFSTDGTYVLCVIGGNHNVS